MCQLGQMDQLSYIHIHSLKQVADKDAVDINRANEISLIYSLNEVHCS